MKFLIFSDLDGTFLNHKNYSYDSLKDFVSKIKKNNHIIFNSSKTFFEIKKINEDLKINFPFIVENGACIFFPKNYLQISKNFFFEYDSYYGYPLVKKNKKFWFDNLSKIRDKFNFNFSFFRELDNSQLKKITNLEDNEIKNSKKRLFSEPIYWNDSKINLHEFTKQVGGLKGIVNIGGRFIHVTDGYDKGFAFTKFLKLVKNDNNKFLTIALGDSQNDLSMLELSDYSCVIKSKKKNLDLKKKNKVYYSKKSAPDGWRESIEHVLNMEKSYF